MKILWNISLLIGWAVAEWEYASEEAFSQSVNSPVITFVNFDTPSDWCTHCQTFREIWTALIADTQGMPEIVLLSIDCDANKPLCDSRGASEGYPALIAFQNGDEINKFPDTAQRTQIALSASIGQMIDDYSVSQLVENSWDAAFDYCEVRNMSMVTIVGEGQQVELVKDLKDALGERNETHLFHIGLRANQQTARWEWRYSAQDGAAKSCSLETFSVGNDFWKFDDYAESETRDAECAAMAIGGDKYPADANWVTGNCATNVANASFICMERVAEPKRCENEAIEEETSEEEVETTSRPYAIQLLPQAASWNNGYQYCRMRNMTMATIVGQSQQVELVTYLKRYIRDETGSDGAYSFYIALNRRPGATWWRWQYRAPGDQRANDLYCPTGKFSPAGLFWAPSNPPNALGGSIEFNCVSLQINDIRYSDNANWVPISTELFFSFKIIFSGRWRSVAITTNRAETVMFAFQNLKNQNAAKSRQAEVDLAREMEVQMETQVSFSCSLLSLQIL